MRRQLLCLICRDVVILLLLLSLSITTISAFAPPALQTRTNRLPTTVTPIIITTTGHDASSTAHTATSSITTRKHGLLSRYTSFNNGAETHNERDTSSSDDETKEGDDDNDKNKDNTGGWLRWMMGGKQRGTNKVVHREAKELGGVPRSDRYSSRDWFHSTITLPNSAILRDIRNPVLAVTTWATFWSLLHHYLLKHGSTAAAAGHLYLPSAPHSLMMSALGLLLVFRTNSAYQRFAEGRKIWERVINASRDLYRMIMLYEEQITVERRRRLQRLLAAFPYLLRHRIRPNLVMYVRVDDEQVARDPDNTILLYQDSGPTDYDTEAAVVAQAEEQTGMGRRKQRPLYWVDKRTLPWRLLPPGALEKCCQVQNRPLWCCDRMAAELVQVPDGPAFAARERLALISHVNKLSACVGGAERIHQTVVPLNYARHTLRALTLWLFSLPFAVMKDLKLLTGPVLFLVSWLLFGVYEIG